MVKVCGRIFFRRSVILKPQLSVIDGEYAYPYLTMDIFYCIQEFLKGLGEENVTISPEVTDIKRIPKVIVSVDTTKMYLKEQFQAAILRQETVSQMITAV